MTVELRPPVEIQQTSSPTLLFVFLITFAALLTVPARVDGSFGASLGGIVMVVLLAPAVVAVARWVLRQETDSRIHQIVMMGLLAKLLGTIVRYYVSLELFNADAAEYHDQGARLAPSFRDLDFTVDIGRAFVGTGFIRVLTGVLYAITGANRFGGFVFYAALAMVGTLLFFRAFRIALPEGDGHRYAVLLFLIPSLLFWPSSIGKESWMLLTLGITALGAALVLTNARSGLLVAAVGLAGTAVVRPHVAVIAFGALAVAYGLRRTPLERRTSTTGTTRIIGIAVLIVAGGFLVTFTQDFFGRGLGTESFEEILNTTSDRTTQGGSDFTPIHIRSPRDFPEAIVTVLYRPLPTEAHNGAARVAAMEGSLLLVLTLISLPRLAGVPRRIFTSPYVAGTLVFIVLFVYAFAVIGNFGILARQRTQLLPFVLVLLALPRPERAKPAAQKLTVGWRGTPRSSPTPAAEGPQDGRSLR